MIGARTDIVQDEYKRPVPGASVYVYNQDGTAAVLTSDGTTPLPQPIGTDEFGNYSYWAADGFYREDIWFAGKLRYRAATVAVGTTAVEFESNLATLSPIASDITVTAAHAADVTTIAPSIANVSTVAGSIANVNTTAASIGAVNTCAANIAAILDAPNKAAAAANSATAAANSAASIVDLSSVNPALVARATWDAFLQYMISSGALDAAGILRE